MSLEFETHGAQIDGARDYQEDAFLITPIISETEGKSALLAVLADGMGGHAAGNVASNLAVEAFTQHITDHYFSSENHNLLLKEALVVANESLAHNIKETAALKGMGCTLVGVLFTETGMQWISVGDSHLFLYRNGKLLKKNADHSYGGYLDRMAAEGNHVDENNGYSRHMLLSALTGEPIPAVDSPEQPILLQAGDQVLLSSDGIDTLSREDIASLLQAQDSAKATCSSLLARVSAAQMPRQDNTTVVMISWPVSEEEKAADEALHLDPLPEAKPNPTQTKQSPLNPPYSASQSEQRRPPKGNISPLYFLLLLITVVGVGWYFSQGLGDAGNTGNDVTHMELEPISDPETSTAGSDVKDASEAEVQENTHAEDDHQFTLFNDRLKSGNLAPGMIPLPTGIYQMGGTGVSPPANERPRHQVKIDAFAISQNEITEAEFAAFSGKKINKSKAKLPVRFVSFDDAQKYTAWLSQQTGSQYRLPTEAEWEYAARAGTSSPYWWGYQFEEDKATCVGCGVPMEPKSPTKVGEHTANAYGLNDVAGNVAEWTQDCYVDNYVDAPTDGSARLITPCPDRVIRGGAYTNAVKSIQSSTRESAHADARSASVGFRVVRELP